MIRRSPSKLILVFITAWWALIPLAPGPAFNTPNLIVFHETIRYDWVVTLLAGLLAILQALDFARKLPARVSTAVWASTMLWWLFIAGCIVQTRFITTGTGAYLAFAALAAAAWWQRKDEVARA